MGLASGAAFADERAVQVSHVHLESGIVTLYNYGATDQSLDGWRIVTADATVSFDATAGGLDGRVIEAGTEFHIYWNDDAPAADPDAIDVSDLGGSVCPLAAQPFGLALYRSSAFFLSEDMVDYLQWSTAMNAAGNANAGAQAPLANEGGLWLIPAEFIVTPPGASLISLVDTSGAPLQDACDYAVDGLVQGSPRNVQIKRIEFDTGVVTLFNYGALDEALDTFQLCTADENETFKYTTIGLAGRTIEGGTEFRLHFFNDSPNTDPTNEANISVMGGVVAVPLDRGPYGLSIYWALPFLLPANMADYVQWTDSPSNPGNMSADARAPTADNANLWLDDANWVVSDPAAVAIDFIGDPAQDGGAGDLEEDSHSSDDYELDMPSSCPADVDGNLDVGFADLTLLLLNWGPCVDCPADLDGNDDVGFADLTLVLLAWGPC